MRSDKSARSFRHILDAIDRIENLTLGMDRDSFDENDTVRLAVERLLQIITEAAKRLGEDGPRLCPEIPWRDVQKLGNVLRHEYDGVDIDQVWDTVVVDLRPLSLAVSKALASLEDAAARITRIGVLLSGRGSNFLAIHGAIARGELPGCEIVVVLANKASAAGLAAARQLGIEARFLSTKGLGVEERDRPYLEALEEMRVDLVCLAGYMRVISAAFVAAYRGRILNVHPSLLPSFAGLDAQAQAIDAGVKVAGCTVHFVDEQVDHGVVIVQRCVAVEDDDTAETLAERILIEEHQAYPEAIRRVMSGEYDVRGRRFLRKA